MDSSFFVNRGPFALKKVAEVTGSQLIPSKGVDIQASVNSVAPLDIATNKDITFCTNAKYFKNLEESKAVACFISQKDQAKMPSHMCALVSDNPYYAYALAMEMFYTPKYQSMQQQSLVDSSSKIADTAVINAGAVIGADVEIGDETVIAPGAVIGHGVKIGKRCHIGSNVAINFSVLGNDVIVFSGAQLGQDGFGFATNSGVHKKILHVGKVQIGNDVEIGANTTIDRGVYNDTFIEDGVRIDNLVQIGHNVHIGQGSVIVAQAGIAGSSKLGAYCVIGGQVGIAGHITLGNQVQIAAQGGVIADVADKAIMGGTPCVPLRQWHKQSIILKKLASGKQNDRK